MKILFILGAYKPRASANGLCSEKVVEEFLKNGHDVTILCNKNVGTNDFLKISDNFKIYRIKQRLYLRLIEWSYLNKNKHYFISKILNLVAYFINKVQLFLMTFFWPNISIITNLKFQKKAIRLQKKYKFNVIISVYTPIESLLAGYKVKKKFPDVKFYPYFLDSLSGGYGPKYFSKKTIISRGVKIERKIYKIADSIIFMESSRTHQLRYNFTFQQKFVFFDIPMLSKPKFLKFQKSNNNKIKLLYVGSINKKVRNPDTLLKALEKLNRDDVFVQFIGKIDCIEDFTKLSKIMGNRLSFIEFLSHEEVTKLIQSANILINIGNNISTMVPSKIFEYMSFGKPIISTYDINDEPSKNYLTKYPAVVFISGRDNCEINSRKISTFIDNNINKNIEYEYLENIFFKNTPKAIVQYIEKDSEKLNE